MKRRTETNASAQQSLLRGKSNTSGWDDGRERHAVQRNSDGEFALNSGIKKSRCFAVLYGEAFQEGLQQMISSGEMAHRYPTL
ncbi:MAG: hypothetical protein U5N27_21330 [Rhizobium sp.]|nr:hypothetical protein [Rhizobium sp.]